MQNLKFRTKLNIHSFCCVMDSPNCKIFLNFSNISSKMQHTAEPGVAQHMRYTKSTNSLKIFPLILIPELPQKLSDPPKYAIFFAFLTNFNSKIKDFQWNLMFPMKSDGKKDLFGWKAAGSTNFSLNFFFPLWVIWHQS